MLRKIILSIFSGILLILVFPKFNLSWLAWIALVPLFFAISKRNLKESFALGFLTGFVAYLGILYWIVPTIVAAVEHKFLGLACLLLLSAYLGLYYGIFCLGVKINQTSGRAGFNLPLNGALKRALPGAELIFIPALWVTLEFLRGWFFSGFPWALLGYSQWNHPAIIQISEYTGVYGVSFLIVMGNVCLYNVLVQFIEPVISTKAGRFPFKQIAITGIILLLFFGWGFLKLSNSNNIRNSPDSISVGLLQGNINQHMKWDKKYEDLIMNKYSNLIKEVKNRKLSIIIWPETAVPGYLMHDYRLLNWVRSLTGEVKCFQIIGSPEMGSQRYYNSAFLISPKGEILDRYRKVHLVPFGEMLPLRPMLSKFGKVFYKIGEFTAGEEYKSLKTPFGNFACIICFEAIFPELVRKFIKRGADYLVNITNDAWFLKTAAPYQHFVMNVFRAVENRIPVIRVGNTGISGFIDRYGRIRKTTKIFQTSYLVDRVFKRNYTTFYTKYGNIFVLLCGLFSGGLIVAKFCNR
ncbi:apolipoprotein N-acyltransferase [bacterium]|nr:apolipoprotein N-acyltransferase [bacterium]